MTTAYELLIEALGVLESEYEGTDNHQKLIEDIRTYIAPQHYSPEDRKRIMLALKNSLNIMLNIEEQRNNDTK